MTLDDEIVSDLHRRCFIARNKSELKEIFTKYKEKTLISKWSQDIIDKYIYPYNKGNPGENIAKYIESIKL